MSRAAQNKKIAELQFENDQLEKEVEFVDSLLRSVGFTDGLSTLKMSALEVLEEEANFQTF